METWYSDAHLGHAGLTELSYGELLPCFELPVRAEAVLARVRAVRLGEIRAPIDAGRAPIERVHDPDYVDFLQGAWAQWTALGRGHPMIPMIWRASDRVPSASARQRPSHVDGLLGWWSQDAACSLVAGSWNAIYWSAQCALGAADRVARRGDVVFASLHADPAVDYPFFAGHADERGEGGGYGATLNLPLPHGTGWERYDEALGAACTALEHARCDAVVVSLGVDTFESGRGASLSP
jgi:acetoin utilization deacetylase AcuC-like enzyme